MINFAERIEAFFETIRKAPLWQKALYEGVFFLLILSSSFIRVSVVNRPDFPNPVTVLLLFLLSWYLGFIWGIACVVWTVMAELLIFSWNGISMGSLTFFRPEQIPFLFGVGTVLAWVISRLGKSNRAIKHTLLKQLKTESELRFRQEQLSAIAQAIPVILFALDAEGRVTAVEGQGLSLINQQPETLIGQPLWQLFDKHLEPHEEQMDVQQNPIIKQMGLGDQIWEVLTIANFDAQYQVIGAYGIATNVTQQKQIESDLREAQKLAEETSLAKSYFLATMSHELRTPLTAIIGYAELLQEIENDATKVKRYAGKVLWSGHSLLEIVDNILDLSKIESGLLPVQWETTDVASLVQSLIDVERPLFNKNQLRLELEPHLPLVQTDPAKLRKILRHLLENANKFTENGTIILSVQASSMTHLSITIQDTGIGMTKEQQQLLFKPFQQGDMSMTRQYGGIGLGLAVTKQLCDLIGATLTVKSTWEKGTAVTIQLPVQQK